MGEPGTRSTVPAFVREPVPVVLEIRIAAEGIFEPPEGTTAFYRDGESL
jgi:hypothetical protein